jgi:hypothetical protein
MQMELFGLLGFGCFVIVIVGFGLIGMMIGMIVIGIVL